MDGQGNGDELVALEDAARAHPGQADDAFEVWPENWERLVLFCACATQWKVDGMSGQWLGFDYGGVEALMRMRGVTDTAAAIGDLQLMESAALAVLNRKRA